MNLLVGTKLHRVYNLFYPSSPTFSFSLRLSELYYSFHLRTPSVRTMSSTLWVRRNSCYDVDPYSVPQVAASILVESVRDSNDTKNPSPIYLLIQRGKEPAAGKWALPGGRVRFGERIRDAALRELEEEAKLGRDDVTIVSDAILSTDAIYEYQYHYVISTIAASLPFEKQDEVIASDDAIDARWLSLEQIEQLHHQEKLASNIPDLIQKFNALRSNENK